MSCQPDVCRKGPHARSQGAGRSHESCRSLEVATQSSGQLPRSHVEIAPNPATNERRRVQDPTFDGEACLPVLCRTVRDQDTKQRAPRRGTVRPGLRAPAGLENRPAGSDSPGWQAVEPARRDHAHGCQRAASSAREITMRWTSLVPS